MFSGCPLAVLKFDLELAKENAGLSLEEESCKHQ